MKIDYNEVYFHFLQVEIREKEAKDFFTDIEKHKDENKQLKEELRRMKMNEIQLFDYVLQAQKREHPPPIPPAARNVSMVIFFLSKKSCARLIFDDILKAVQPKFSGSIFIYSGLVKKKLFIL